MSDFDIKKQVSSLSISTQLITTVPVTASQLSSAVALWYFPLRAAELFIQISTWPLCQLIFPQVNSSLRDKLEEDIRDYSEISAVRHQC